MLASAAYDAGLWSRLSPALAMRRTELAATLADTLRRGDTSAKPDDDPMVFLKPNMIGFDHLELMEAAASVRGT